MSATATKDGNNNCRGTQKTGTKNERHKQMKENNGPKRNRRNGQSVREKEKRRNSKRQRRAKETVLVGDCAVCIVLCLLPGRKEKRTKENNKHEKTEPKNLETEWNTKKKRQHCKNETKRKQTKETGEKNRRKVHEWDKWCMDTASPTCCKCTFTFSHPLLDITSIYFTSS